MRCIGQDVAGTGTFRSVGYSVVVGGDQHFGGPALQCALINVKDHRFSGNLRERLPGQPARFEARRNHHRKRFVTAA
jgi:hypothetical protein